MSDLRFVGKSADGDYIEMVDDLGNPFRIRISDSLKNSINERRLNAVVEDAPKFSIKEIQARLRAGESYAEVSRISGLSVEKIERYSSPIMQERAWIIEQAEKTSPKGSSASLHDLVVHKLSPRGVNMNQVSWNTWRLDNGTWHLVLSYPGNDGTHNATWNFDANKRVLLASDDGARWINGEEISKQQPKPDRMSDHGVVCSVDGETPTPPRLVAVRTDDVSTDSKTTQESEIPSDAKKDGVSKRISIPSWDDIMFGRSKKKDESED